MLAAEPRHCLRLARDAFATSVVEPPAGADPTNPDSDGDGLTDCEELTEGEELTESEELTEGDDGILTDPLVPDEPDGEPPPAP